MVILADISSKQCTAITSLTPLKQFKMSSSLALFLFTFSRINSLNLFFYKNVLDLLFIGTDKNGDFI